MCPTRSCPSRNSPGDLGPKSGFVKIFSDAQDELGPKREILGDSHGSILIVALTQFWGRTGIFLRGRSHTAPGGANVLSRARNVEKSKRG